MRIALSSKTSNTHKKAESRLSSISSIPAEVTVIISLSLKNLFLSLPEVMLESLDCKIFKSRNIIFWQAFHLILLQFFLFLNIPLLKLVILSYKIFLSIYNQTFSIHIDRRYYTIIYTTSKRIWFLFFICCELIGKFLFILCLFL